MQLLSVVPIAVNRERNFASLYGRQNFAAAIFGLRSICNMNVIALIKLEFRAATCGIAHRWAIHGRSGHSLQLADREGTL